MSCRLRSLALMWLPARISTSPDCREQSCRDLITCLPLWIQTMYSSPQPPDTPPLA